MSVLQVCNLMKNKNKKVIGENADEFIHPSNN